MLTVAYYDNHIQVRVHTNISSLQFKDPKISWWWETPTLPGFDTTCRILEPIELPLILKPIGDVKRHNNDFMVCRLC